MSLNMHHRRALVTITAAALLDTGLGAWFGIADHVGVPDGLYWATTTATTVGYGDVTPRGWLPHILAIGVMITVIPLFGAAFSLFTTGLASQDIRGRIGAAEKRIKDHVEARFQHHLKGAASDAQV